MSKKTITKETCQKEVRHAISDNHCFHVWKFFMPVASKPSEDRPRLVVG